MSFLLFLALLPAKFQHESISLIDCSICETNLSLHNYLYYWAHQGTQAQSVRVLLCNRTQSLEWAWCYPRAALMMRVSFQLASLVLKVILETQHPVAHSVHMQVRHLLFFREELNTLTNRNLKGYWLVPNLPINHCGFKKCPKEEELFKFLSIDLLEKKETEKNDIYFTFYSLSFFFFLHYRDFTSIQQLCYCCRSVSLRLSVII